ncbi:uncharacterized protein A1O9_08701 [Exophiala aquamarina CBS 119918]|uniref:Zn(2)-C6 fungal-type domain-containing protein n=1 Tax=Exophiala aquamarina CBS 119918 TaxID=1182545 RepID=A0A072P6Y2_9EURO|nr:uncharacterized protein A1O9_08701 [Exophiala aquamarina CBS 119918]KEF55048.1 hypothetical protein A1O9_08701 [Exophiala aquamarina CBS 119918]
MSQEPPTKRAGRACLSCRSRKIRCNFEECGPPCSNCLTDDIECFTAKSRRGKRPYRHLRNKAKASKDRNATGANKTSSNPNVKGCGAPVLLSKVFPTHTAGWLDDNVESPLLSQHGVDAPKHCVAQLDERFLHQELTYASLVDKGAVHTSLSAALTPRSLSAPPPPCISENSFKISHGGLPTFVKPLSPDLTPDDIDYLRMKGALDVPSPKFMKAILTAYAHFVHPMMPTIDLSCCVGVLAGKSASIGILTLQAIAFTAIPFVDLSDIRKVGFDTRRACRKAFYNKTRLLYDHDVESEKISIIQAVLLMAYWNEKPGDNRGAWYWTGIAITLAQTLGMHRQAEYKVKSQETKLFKRVWWSCYTRDRMLGIAMGRYLRIRDEEFDTPPLTLEDFDFINYPGEEDTIFPSMDDQISLAEMCINATEICKLSGKILALHFSVLQDEFSTSTARGDNGSTATMLFAKRSSPGKELVQIYDDQLQALYSRLSPSCSYRILASQGVTSRCIMANAASLYITFWTAVSALHRPQLRERDKTVSAARVEEAAIEVSRVDREMHKSGLGRYLPATASVSFQITTFITHTKRLERQETEDVAEVLESLFFCIKLIETGREAFPGGDQAFDMMSFIALLANITLLFDSESNLWGVEYHGVHVCPGSRQLNLDASTVSSSFKDVSPCENVTDLPLTRHDEMPCTKRDLQSIDPQALSFDHMDAIDWGSLADFLPLSNTDDEHFFGTIANSDCLQSVKMG